MRIFAAAGLVACSPSAAVHAARAQSQRACRGPVIKPLHPVTKKQPAPAKKARRRSQARSRVVKKAKTKVAPKPKPRPKRVPAVIDGMPSALALSLRGEQ
jgi:hypothetical protein